MTAKLEIWEGTDKFELITKLNQRMHGRKIINGGLQVNFTNQGNKHYTAHFYYEDTKKEGVGENTSHKKAKQKTQDEAKESIGEKLIGFFASDDEDD